MIGQMNIDRDALRMAGDELKRRLAELEDLPLEQQVVLIQSSSMSEPEKQMMIQQCAFRKQAYAHMKRMRKKYGPPPPEVVKASQQRERFLYRPLRTLFAGMLMLCAGYVLVAGVLAFVKMFFGL